MELDMTEVDLTKEELLYGYFFLMRENLRLNKEVSRMRDIVVSISKQRDDAVNRLALREKLLVMEEDNA